MPRNNPRIKLNALDVLFNEYHTLEAHICSVGALTEPDPAARLDGCGVTSTSSISR